MAGNPGSGREPGSFPGSSLKDLLRLGQTLEAQRTEIAELTQLLDNQAAVLNEVLIRLAEISDRQVEALQRLDEQAQDFEDLRRHVLALAWDRELSEYVQAMRGQPHGPGSEVPSQYRPSVDDGLSWADRLLGQALLIATKQAYEGYTPMDLRDQVQSELQDIQWVNELFSDEAIWTASFRAVPFDRSGTFDPDQVRRNLRLLAPHLFELAPEGDDDESVNQRRELEEWIARVPGARYLTPDDFETTIRESLPAEQGSSYDDTESG